MNQTYMKEKPILPLLLSMALPMVISMMVNSLYNIVDQIFVGQGVGITGMAATNVAFPLVVLVNAIALMLGDGCAANISLCLGRKQQREADDTISHSVTLMIVGGIICALGSFLFAPQIAVLFGSTDTAKRAESYKKVIEKVMNEYTGIYYAYECRNWAVSPKVHNAVLRADNQMLVATPFNNIWIEE